MFLDYYKFAEQPFGVTPDPRFLYMGSKHREAFASLVYGTESNRGLLAMIAEPGMGKTTLLYKYLSQFRREGRTAFVFRNDCGPHEFIRQVLIDLGIDVSGMNLPATHEALNRLLTEEIHAGRRFVLVVDEAQGLGEKTLESIRLLSNFETPWIKLMLIVLAGQPELASRLARPALSQLRQRISMVIRIEPLTHEEVNAYIDHRLWVAGGKDPSLFTLDARRLIAGHSRGIPRNINNICFNAMSLGCALHRETIDRDIICEVIADLDLGALKEKSEIIVNLEPEPLKKRSEIIADREPEPLREPNIVVENLEDGQELASPILSEASRRNSFSCGSIFRLAIASVLLLTLLGSADQLNRNESRDVDVVTRAVAPSSSAVMPISSADNAELMFGQTRDSVLGVPGQTRCPISVGTFDNYDGGVLGENPGLNSWQSGLDCIQSGQERLIPSATIIKTSKDALRTAEHVSSTPTAWAVRR